MAKYPTQDRISIDSKFWPIMLPYPAAAAPHERAEDDSKEKGESEEGSKGEDAGCDGDQNVSSKRVRPTGRKNRAW